MRRKTARSAPLRTPGLQVVTAVSQPEARDGGGRVTGVFPYRVGERT